MPSGENEQTASATLTPALPDPSLIRESVEWWREASAHEGRLAAAGRLLQILREFLRDSAPARRRQRYGDVDYDWDHGADTTSATVGWRARLMGLLHSPYQPTDPALFREMMGALAIDFREFVFIDIGSGKGRALLMAAEYRFRRILGVELLPGLHRIAQRNIARCRKETQCGVVIESICMDARDFVFSPDPSVIYLFNPLPETGLRRLLDNLERSQQDHPRPTYVLYHNPLLESVVRARQAFRRIRWTHQYILYEYFQRELRASDQ